MVFNCFLGLLKKYIILLLYHLFLECVSILISKMSEILLLGIIMNSETFIYLCVSVHCSCFSFDPEIVLPLVIGSPYQLVPMSFVLFLFNFWLPWVFDAARGLSLLAAAGGCSSCATWAPLTAERRFQVRGLQELQHVSSVVVGGRPQSMWLQWLWCTGTVVLL